MRANSLAVAQSEAPAGRPLRDNRVRIYIRGRSFPRAKAALALVKFPTVRWDSPPKVRFAADSPLEGAGFEPSVPRPTVSSGHLGARRDLRPNGAKRGMASVAASDCTHLGKLPVMPVLACSAMTGAFSKPVRRFSRNRLLSPGMVMTWL